MTVFSSLRKCCGLNRNNLLNSFMMKVKNNNGQSVRLMSEHRTFPMVPSRWQYNKFKDLLHFYVMLGLIPGMLVVMYTNIFIGPATLTPIPEGYTPEYWEYYKHPITRFIARHIMPHPQQEYEKYMHYLYEQDELRKLRLLEKKIKGLMRDRTDYQAYYYIPYTNANTIRIEKEQGEYFSDRFGTNN